MRNNELQAKILRLEQERDKLKTELHSKVEFIQEQRTIINEYAKEIEIYKQCQGKRASKREEELEQENKELQAYKDINEDFKQAWDELNEKYKQLRSALEEIRTYLDTLSSVDSDFTNTETYLRIQDKINEVLN